MVFNGDAFHLTDFSALSPLMQHQAIALVIDAFYQHRTDVTRREALIKLGDSFFGRKEIAFCITDRKQVVGISSYVLYDYNRIEKQMYMETQYQDGCLTAMRLISFHDLLCKSGVRQGTLTKVAGFGYSFVLPEFRKQGLAKLLFRRRLEDIQLNEEVGVVFAIVRGPYAQKNVSQPIMSLLLDAEEHTNGQTYDHQVKITGVWVECARVEDVLNLPISSLNDYSGSPAMTKLIADSGFVPIGFFRSLSPVWATTRSVLRQRQETMDHN